MTEVCINRHHGQAAAYREECEVTVNAQNASYGERQGADGKWVINQDKIWGNAYEPNLDAFRLKSACDQFKKKNTPLEK